MGDAQPGSQVYGIFCCRVLDALLYGSRAPTESEAVLSWAKGVMATAQGAGLGIDHDSLPAEWREALAYVGAPIARPGTLRFGQDLLPGQVPVPALDGGRLLLPEPAKLTQLSSLQLKPLRLFFAERFGFRLQAASALRLYLWPKQTLVVSMSSIPVGGFVYGSTPGQRAALSLEPGGHQVISW